jgi:hypothetical protein
MPTSDKFKIGDRVVCVGAYDQNTKIIGVSGTVIHQFINPSNILSVEFDEEIEGHSGGGNGGKDGYCWNVQEDFLRASKQHTLRYIKDNLVYGR